MFDAKSLGGTYSAKWSREGNLLLRSKSCSFTLKPKTLKELVAWLESEGVLKVGSLNSQKTS